METFHVLASQFNKCNTTYLAHGGRRPKVIIFTFVFDVVK